MPQNRHLVDLIDLTIDTLDPWIHLIGSIIAFTFAYKGGGYPALAVSIILFIAHLFQTDFLGHAIFLLLLYFIVTSIILLKEKYYDHDTWYNIYVGTLRSRLGILVPNSETYSHRAVRFESVVSNPNVPGPIPAREYRYLHFVGDVTGGQGEVVNRTGNPDLYVWNWVGFSDCWDKDRAAERGLQQFNNRTSSYSCQEMALFICLQLSKVKLYTYILSFIYNFKISNGILLLTFLFPMIINWNWWKVYCLVQLVYEVYMYTRIAEGVNGPGIGGQWNKDWNKTSNRVILTVLLITMISTWYTQFWYVEATIVTILFILT